MMTAILFQFGFLLSCLISALICVGLGALITKNSKSVGFLGALGILIMGLSSMLVNFFFPLGEVYFYVLCVFSLLGWLMIWKQKDPKHLKELMVMSIAISLYWLLGLRRVLNSDVGLYHIPAIQWMHLSSLPIGLASLHTRFGVWNFWFSVCGGISAGNVMPLAVYSMNIVLVGFASVDFFYWIRDEKNPAGAYSIAVLLLIAFLDTWYFMGGQKSPDADFAGGIVVIWAFSHFIQRKMESMEWIESTILLSGLAILIKLNQAPMVFLLMIAFWYFVKFNTNERNHKKALPLIIFMLITAAGLISIVKTFWTTGCLIFPVEKTCLNVPWSVRPAEVANIYYWVVRWARWPDGPENLVMHNFGWVSHWWAGNGALRIIICTEWILGIFVIIKLIFRKNLPKLDFISLGVVIIGMSYWFLTAPDIRFGFANFVVAFGILLGTLFQFLFGFRKLKRLKAWLVYSMLGSLLITAIGQVRRADDFGMNTLLEPNSKFQLKENMAGQKIYVPDDQSCWRLPLPCTPYFDPGLIESKSMIWTVFEKRR